MPKTEPTPKQMKKKSEKPRAVKAAASITDKAIVLCVLDVLKEYSDVEHPINATQISEQIKESTDGFLSPDRRTIYAALKMLKALDYDVCELPGKGYFLHSRALTISTAKMLIDAVNFFPFINREETQKVTKTIKSIYSKHDRNRLPSPMMASPRKTPIGDKTLEYIEALSAAIQHKKQVSFEYMKWEYADAGANHLTRKPNAKGRYKVHPYALDFFNNHYYLICFNPFHPEKPNNLRVDEMKDIIEEKDDADLSKFSPSALEDSVQRSVYAFAGTPAQITVKADNIGLNSIISEFGMSFEIRKLDKVYVEVKFTAVPDGVVYWALQYMEHVEVLRPLSLRKKVVEAIQQNPYVAVAAPEASSDTDVDSDKRTCQGI